MEIKRQQVEALILQGQKRGLTGKDVIDALVRKGHTPEGVNVQAIKSTFPVANKPIETPEAKLPVTDPFSTVKKTGNILKESGQQIAEGFKQTQAGVNNPSFVSGAKDIVAGTLKEAGGAIRGIFSQLEAALTDVAQLPGAKEALDALKNHVINPLSEKASDIPAVQKFVMDNPNAESNISNAIAIVGTLVGGAKAPAVKTAVTDTANMIKVTARDITDRIMPKNPPQVPPVETLSGMVGDKVKTTINDTPISIMNRVARLSPNEANTFKDLAGMSHGEYLTRTGNFGTPEQIITVEAKKFIDSINQVDTALETLPGVYKTQPLQSMADALVTRAKEVSTPGAPSPYLTQALELQRKLTGDGLLMKETNSLKRLFEQNVKLGYKLEQNPKMVEQATNIDTAVRKWQAAEAEKLGFENLPALNKQTQIAKFMIDELGAKMTGQTGLNAVTITDWIMLSGGNPAAIGGLLVKKVFSSQAVQAKIAKMLAEGESIPAIQAKLGITPANIERQVSPTGAKQLPAPAEGAPQSQNFVPIESRGKSTIEPMASEVKKTSYNPKTGTQYVKDTKTGKTEYINKPTQSKPTKQPQSKISPGKPSSNNTMKGSKVNKSIPKVKGETPETNLINEARKYNSAEQFVKAQGTPKTVRVWSKSKFSNDGSYVDIPVTRKVDNITLYQGGSTEGRQFWTPNKKYAESFGKVTEKTGTFYKVDNGNRVTDVYVEAPTKSHLTDIWKKAAGKKK